MAIYPGAVWRPINKNYTKEVTTKDCVIGHVSDSETATSLFHWFMAAGARASSHFHVAKNGVIEQYIDTKYVSWASAQANRRSISIETQGGAKGKWTPEQVAAIVKLIAWICKTHKIPVRQMASSLASEKGIGWHRLGVRGNFPALPSIQAGLTQRGKGQSWSGVVKVCPGNDRIEQMPGIIAQVKAITTGTTAPKPSTPAPTKPAPTKPKPAPAKPAVKKLAIDGYWGEDTTTRLQQVLGMKTVDGILSSQYKSRHNSTLYSAKWVSAAVAKKSGGSLTVKELQRRLGVTQDGLLGPATIKALQQKLGTHPDGVISSPSSVVKALQRNLNSGKIW